MALQNQSGNCTFLQEIEGLPYKTVAQLHNRYLEVFGEPSRSNHKQFRFGASPGGCKLWPKATCQSARVSAPLVWRAMPISGCVPPRWHPRQPSGLRAGTAIPACLSPALRSPASSATAPSRSRS